VRCARAFHSQVAQISVDIDRGPGEPDPPRPGRHPNTCPICSSHYRDDELAAALRVCSQCGHHFRLPARERIAHLADAGSFDEAAADLRNADPLAFIDRKPYSERLTEAELATGLGDAMLVGTATVGGKPCVLAVMDFFFMGGSMGSVVGEKFCVAADLAVAHGAPLVAVASSGGARMQENVLALMQMAKTVMAVDQVRDARLPFISICSDPTTGGVIASFAALGDVMIAEPGALMSFAGPRVVQQTTGESLPEDFGRAESQLRLGHVDLVVPRADLTATLARLLLLFAPSEDEATGDLAAPVSPPAGPLGWLRRLFGGDRG
jgi:acetyl-CoA carboxylase carboxyl transferase beta subunit